LNPPGPFRFDLSKSGLRPRRTRFSVGLHHFFSHLARRGAGAPGRALGFAAF
jgi:hypothetical protein